MIRKYFYENATEEEQITIFRNTISNGTNIALDDDELLDLLHKFNKQLQQYRKMKNKQAANKVATLEQRRRRSKNLNTFYFYALTRQNLTSKSLRAVQREFYRDKGIKLSHTQIKKYLGYMYPKS